MAQLPGDLHVRQAYDGVWLLLDGDCERVMEITEDDLLRGCEHVLNKFAQAFHRNSLAHHKAGRAALAADLRRLLEVKS